jgi:hypothetical protein
MIVSAHICQTGISWSKIYAISFGWKWKWKQKRLIFQDLKIKINAHQEVTQSCFWRIPHVKGQDSVRTRGLHSEHHYIRAVNHKQTLLLHFSMKRELGEATFPNKQWKGLRGRNGKKLPYKNLSKWKMRVQAHMRKKAAQKFVLSSHLNFTSWRVIKHKCHTHWKLVSL